MTLWVSVSSLLCILPQLLKLTTDSILLALAVIFVILFVFSLLLLSLSVFLLILESEMNRGLNTPKRMIVEIACLLSVFRMGQNSCRVRVPVKEERSQDLCGSTKSSS